MAFRHGLQLALECRASATAERIRQRLWLTGVHALTPTERRVARLAADDMTNRQIAESLFVTEKTVETSSATSPSPPPSVIGLTTGDVGRSGRGSRAVVGGVLAASARLCDVDVAPTTSTSHNLLGGPPGRAK